MTDAIEKLRALHEQVREDRAALYAALAVLEAALRLHDDGGASGALKEGVMRARRHARRVLQEVKP